MQAASVGSYKSPVGDRLLTDAAGSQRERGVWTGLDVRPHCLGDEERGPEAYDGRLFDFLHCEVVDGHNGQWVARRVDNMVEFASRNGLSNVFEELGNVGFEGGLVAEVADEAFYVAFLAGIGFREQCECGLDALFVRR